MHPGQSALAGEGARLLRVLGGGLCHLAYRGHARKRIAILVAVASVSATGSFVQPAVA